MTALLGNRHGKSAFKGPALTEALNNQATTPAQSKGCFGHRHAFAHEVYNPSRAGVSLLIGLARPMAIFGRVWAVIVATLKGCSDRALAHVLKKRVKALAPSIANDDPSASVSMKVGSAWVMAAPLHVRPNLKLCRFGSAVTCVSWFKDVVGYVAAGASVASRGFTKQEIIWENLLYRPAIALAFHLWPIIGQNGPRPVPSRNSSAFSAVCHAANLCHPQWISRGRHV